MEHEKLICYQSLLEVAQALGQKINHWPKGSSDLADQAKRAITSGILNLAEGNGKRSSTKERKRFFEIAQGSIAELCACLDVSQINNLISPSQVIYLKSRLRHIYYQIRKLP